LTLQWYRQTPYMLGMGLAPLAGGVVVTRAGWEKLSPGDRELVLAAARATEKDLEREVPKQDQSAIDQMRQRGLSVVEITAEEQKSWHDEAQRFAVEARDGRVPAEILGAAEAAIAKYRARPAGSGGVGH